MLGQVISSNITSPITLPTGTTDIGNELCGICNLIVVNDRISRDECSHLYHPSTQSKKSNTITCMQEESGDTIRYVCSECRCHPSVQIMLVVPTCLFLLLN